MKKKIRLGDYCNPSLGQIKEDDDTLIDYIDISSVDNVSKKIIGYQTMTFGSSPSRARKVVKKGNILISTVRPNLNAVAMLEEETPNVSVASTGFCVLDCKPNVNSRFILNFCQSKSFIDDMVSQATGASYPAVSEKIVRSALVPEYSYEEQSKIGKIFDAIADLIENREKQLEKLDLLVKSRFVEMFDNIETNRFKLDKLDWSDVFSTTTGKLDSNAMVENGKYPFFTCAKEAFKIDTYAFDCEALLLAGNNAAGVYDVKHYKGKFNAYQRTYVLQLKNSNWSYEFFKMQLEDKLAYLKERSIGSNTRYLTLKILQDIQFLIPSEAQQRKFGEFIHQVDKSKFAIKKSLEKLEFLKKKLMQDYFG